MSFFWPLDLRFKFINTYWVLCSFIIARPIRFITKINFIKLCISISQGWCRFELITWYKFHNLYIPTFKRGNCLELFRLSVCFQRIINIFNMTWARARFTFCDEICLPFASLDYMLFNKIKIYHIFKLLVAWCTFQTEMPVVLLLHSKVCYIF